MSAIPAEVASAVAAQQSAVQTQVQYSIQAKQLSAYRQAGQAAADLLQAALQLSKEAGKGECLDCVG